MTAERTSEILVGAAALVVGAVFLVWAFTGGGIFGTEGYRVTARFGQVDGLTIGSQVRLAGVVVGRVQALDYDPAARQAVMTMEIAEDVRVPEDTSAAIVQNGVLGDKFVNLSPGGAAEPIEPGGEVRYTQGSVLVVDILERIISEAERQRRGTAGSGRSGATGGD